MIASEFTIFAKSGGPLTKRISLAADGSLKSDGSACVMAQGAARRVHIASVSDLARLIERLRPNEAIALGALQTGLAELVQVVTKHKLNGAANVIARTGADIIYRKGQPALALLDFDTKGMPAMSPPQCAAGGYWPAWLGCCQRCRTLARVIRRSTSAGLFRADTGARLPGSDGVHVYVAVQDGTDIERFLKTLHARCWLAGFGWMMVGAAGNSSSAPLWIAWSARPSAWCSRAAPSGSAVRQDRKAGDRSRSRAMRWTRSAACPPLTIAETAQLQELKANGRIVSQGSRRRYTPHLSPRRQSGSPSPRASR